jgi:hypothetical protein
MVLHFTYVVYKIAYASHCSLCNSLCGVVQLARYACCIHLIVRQTKRKLTADVCVHQKGKEKRKIKISALETFSN